MAASPLALDIATALANDGRLYWTSTAAANPDEVAKTAAVIDAILLPRLAAQADKLDSAVRDALVIMTKQDDLAEAMALAIETHFESFYRRDHPQLADALAAWRAYRPTPGLV